MSLPRLAPLLLCLVLPLPGLTQTLAPEAPPPPPVSPPPLIPAPAQPPSPTDSPQTGPSEPGEKQGYEPQGELVPHAWRAEQDSSLEFPRRLLEFLGGAIGESVGVIPGGLIMLNGLCLDECFNSSDTQAILGFTLALAGIAGGTAAGIVGGAALLDGEGLYWPTLAGTAIGTLVGIASGFLLAFEIDEYALIPVIGGPIIGGMIAYELSHEKEVSKRRRFVSSRARVVPLVTVSPRGGFVGGLAGSF